LRDKDYIEELFSRSLEGHEASVRPEIWSAIQSKMAVASVASATAATASKSLLIKGIIGLGSLAVIGIGSYIYFGNDDSSASGQQVHENEKQIISSEDPAVKNENAVKSDNKSSEELIKEDLHLTYFPPIVTEDLSNSNTTAHTSTLENKVENTEAPAQSGVSVSNEEVKKETGTLKEEIKQPVSVTPAETTNAANTGVAGKSKQGYVKPWNVANVFTPNNDGINDFFFLETGGELKEFSITILDKDNKVVYRSEDTRFKWDGTNYLTGEKVPDGNYSYIIYAVDLNGELIKQFNLLYITK